MMPAMNQLHVFMPCTMSGFPVAALANHGPVTIAIAQPPTSPAIFPKKVIHAVSRVRSS
jgi:hypothetical protein